MSLEAHKISSVRFVAFTLIAMLAASVLCCSPASAGLVYYQATSDGNLPSVVGSGNATGFPDHSSGGTSSWDFDNITSADNPTGAWYMNTNDPSGSGSSAFYRTDGVPSGTSDRYFTSTIRFHSLSADSVAMDFVVGGVGNHGATQALWNTGSDGVIGGSGPAADTIQVYDYVANTVVLSAPADLANFHNYTVQRVSALGVYQLYIDGQIVGSAPITLFSDAPSGDKEQYFPSSGGAAISNFDVQIYAFDTDNVLFVPEPASLSLIAIGALALRRRRA